MYQNRSLKRLKAILDTDLSTRLPTSDELELVILSACQTAVQENSDGSEISGIAYLFEQAGAKSVMASL